MTQLGIFAAQNVLSGLSGFISTWDTTTPNETISLPLIASGSYDFIVNWGDGGVDFIIAFNQAEVTHNYVLAGTHVVTIEGDISGFSFNASGDRLKIKNISNWGSLELTENGWFFGCSNLTVTAMDVPIINTTLMLNVFRGCLALTTIPNMEQWDISLVTNLNSAFRESTNFNQPLNNLNVSSVTGMFAVFSSSGYNQPINNWDVSSVGNLGSMLEFTPFNQPLDNWILSSAFNMTDFLDATPFDITNYDPFLLALDAQTLQSGVSFSAGTAQFSAGAPTTARTSIISNDLWTITDGGQAP